MQRHSVAVTQSSITSSNATSHKVQEFLRSEKYGEIPQLLEKKENNISTNGCHNASEPMIISHYVNRKRL